MQVVQDVGTRLVRANLTAHENERIQQVRHHRRLDGSERTAVWRVVQSAELSCRGPGGPSIFS